MKQFFVFTIAVFFVAVSNAQFVTIPDPTFRQFLMDKFPTCFNVNEEMDASCPQVLSEDSLSYEWPGIIYNLSGIEYFTGLRYFSAANINFEQNPFPILPASLQHLRLRYVTFTNGFSLNPLPATWPAGLRKLEFTYANSDFTGYNWPASLRYLDVSYNSASSLGNLPIGLDTLICNSEGLIISQFTPNGISYIQTSASLASLPALPQNLKFLQCRRNNLTTLPTLPATLKWLDCSNSVNFFEDFGGPLEMPSLQTLPALPAGLIFLNCAKNRLTQLPQLPASLTYLDCSENNYLSVTTCCGSIQYPGISELPDLPAALQYLNLFYNPSLLCLPKLPAAMGTHSPYNSSIYDLDIRSTGINCIPNTVPGIRINAFGSKPLCNSSNNTNGCIAFPRLDGIVFYDNNNNGIKDAGEMPRSNVKVSLGTGDFAFSDLQGRYEISAAAGPNTLTINPPAYFDAVPPSVSHNVLGNTVFSDTIALQVNTIVDSFQISIVPWESPRPGFNFRYHIKYKNVGSSTLSGDITADYDNTRLTYLNSSVGSVTDDGTALHLHFNNMTPGQAGEFTATFTVSVSTPLSSLINATANLTAGSANTTDSISSIVIGSFDPNDKLATSTLTPLQVNNGAFINYVIRFQNTGTANAINIFITDTLSGLLDENTVEIIETSAACKITQKDNKLLFEFNGINLPASISNEPASHGYVRFRVKPRSSLALNTSVENKASIYFDFNAAIVTDPAVTTVNFTVVPLTLLEFYGVPDVNNNVQLFWKTTNENNTVSFDVERSGNANAFSKTSSVTAVGSGSNSYSASCHLYSKLTLFRLKVYDTDGRFSYSPVITIRSKEKSGVQILGNPAFGKLHIQVNDIALLNTEASILDISGKVVKRFTLVAGHSPDISSLASGIYFLKTLTCSEMFRVR